MPFTAVAQQMQYFNRLNYDKRELREEKEKVTKGLVTENDTSTNDVVSKDTISEISTFPGFTDLLGKNILLPQVEIKGLTNFNSGEKIYGDIKLFTSAFAAKNFSNISLLFPEASAYGVSMSFNWLPFGSVNFAKGQGDNEVHKMKWFCAYFNANYLGKNLQGITASGSASDTTRFTSDVVHFKVGIQVIPKVNFLSFYGDINFLSPVVNKDPLLRFNSSMKSGFSNFLHVGTKFFVAAGGDGKPLNLFVDLSAVWVDDVTRSIYKTNDALISRLSIGGTAKF
jgi:hypothetical protein